MGGSSLTSPQNEAIINEAARRYHRAPYLIAQAVGRVPQDLLKSYATYLRSKLDSKELPERKTYIGTGTVFNWASGWW